LTPSKNPSPSSSRSQPDPSIPRRRSEERRRPSTPSLTQSPSGQESEGVTAALYVRVSTSQQVEKDSLATQESRLRAYCVANGIDRCTIYKDEGLSAKDTDRPQLKRLFEDCKKGRIQVVLVTALDRITRSTRDLTKLVDFFADNNVRFVSITQNIDSTNAFGRFMRDLLGLTGRLEREVVAERVAESMRHRASLGKWNGGMVPYGYTTFQRIMKETTGKRASDDSLKEISEEQARKKASSACPEPKRLYIDPEEARIVKRIFDTFLDTRSLRRTAHILNSLGIKTRKERTWAVSTIHKILTSPVCTGKISYGKTRTDLETGKLKAVRKEEWKVFDGKHKPIVPEKLFKDVQEIVASRSRKPTRAFNTYLLSGLLRCGKCGGSMYGQTFTRKSTGKTYRYYKCEDNYIRGRAVCKGLSVRQEDLDDFVVKTLTDLSKDTVFLQDKEKMLAALREELKPDKGKERLERLKKQERDLEKKVETLLEGWESHVIEKADFAREYEKRKAELRQNRIEQESLSDSVDYSATAYEALNASFEEISNFGRNWEFLDDSGKATRISTIVKQITVHEDKLDIQVYLDKVEEPSTGVSLR
jgi:site-specific DNA recombinase